MPSKQRYTELKSQILSSIRQNLEKEGYYFKENPCIEITENLLRFCNQMSIKLLEFYGDCALYAEKDELWEGVKAAIKTAGGYALAALLDQKLGIAVAGAVGGYGIYDINNILQQKAAAQAFLQHIKCEVDMILIVEQIAIHLAYRFENIINALQLNNNGVDKLAKFLCCNIAAAVMARPRAFESKEDLVGYLLVNSIPINNSAYSSFIGEEKITFLEKSKDRTISSNNRRLKGCLLEAHAITEGGNIYVREGITEPFRYPPHKLIAHSDANNLGFKSYFSFNRSILSLNQEKIIIPYSDEQKIIFTQDMQKLFTKYKDLEERLSDFRYHRNKSKAQKFFNNCNEYLNILDKVAHTLKIKEDISEGQLKVIFLIAFIQDFTKKVYDYFKEVSTIVAPTKEQQAIFNARIDYLFLLAPKYVESIQNHLLINHAQKTILHQDLLSNIKNDEEEVIVEIFTPNLDARPKKVKLPLNKYQQIWKFIKESLDPHNTAKSVDEFSAWSGWPKKVCWTILSVGGVIVLGGAVVAIFKVGLAAGLTILVGGEVLNFAVLPKAINFIREQYVKETLHTLETADELKEASLEASEIIQNVKEEFENQLKKEFQSANSVLAKHYHEHEDDIIKIQSIFRGFRVRNSQPLSELSEKRQNDVKKEGLSMLNQLIKQKKYAKAVELSDAIKNEYWHSALQIIKGIEETEYSLDGVKFKY
jgi:hypothetical protein